MIKKKRNLEIKKEVKYYSFLHWIIFFCFINLCIILIYTNKILCSEPKSVVKITKSIEKIRKEEEEFKLKQFFFEYLNKKYKLYNLHLNYILDSIFKHCKQKNLSPCLVIALIETESGFNYQAVSSQNAIGLMQIHSPSWQTLNLKNINLYDPDVNIDKGTDILRIYIDKNKGDINKALEDYCGKSDESYITKIMSLIGTYYVQIQQKTSIYK